MKQFIKLSTRLINKAHIIGITKAPQRYIIEMTNSERGGWYLFGVGYWWSNTNLISICETHNKQDYEIIKKYIKDL